MPEPRQYESNADRQRAYRERQKQALAEQLAAKKLPALPTIPTMPGTARWTAQREQARLLLQTMRDEIETYIGDRSEEWQETENAQKWQAAVDQTDNALSEIETIEM